MDEAFLALLETKDLSYITVKEICARAGVNRSTFYLHYETVADLLAESAQYIIRQFQDAMPYDTVSFLEKLQTCPLEELYLITAEYLAPYLEYVRAHRRVFRTVLEQASVLRMDDAYAGLSRHVLTPILDRFQVPPDDQPYMLSFYIGGLTALLREWLQNDCQKPIKDLTALIQTCIPGKK